MLGLTKPIKSWVVYMLKLRNGAYYTGITNDLPARLKKHQEGNGSKYVRAHLPLCLVYVEKAKDRVTAAQREREIKKLGHVEKIKLVEGETNGR